MDNNFSNFLKISDGEQIFYTTNFKPTANLEDVLVFNYGLVCSNFHYSKQIKYFDDLGFKILLHDYRGHYQSSGGHDLSQITFSRIANDLIELVDHLQIKSLHLIGHSMGVNVCLEFAKLYPKITKSMILISGTIIPVHNIMMDTHLTGPLKPILLGLMEKFPKEFDLFWKYGGWNPLVKRAIHAGGFNLEQVSDEFIQVYLNKLGQLGPQLFFHLVTEMHDHDILAFVHNIKTRTLLIGGTKDKVIPNFLQKLCHEKLENSELYLIHEGSHVPQVDFPGFTNERMTFFLNP